MSFTELLNAKADVYRRADQSDPTNSDGMGPVNDAGDWSTKVAALVPCRVTQASARARFYAARAGADVSVQNLIIFTDYRTDIQARDRFMVVEVEGEAILPPSYYDTTDLNDPGLAHHHLEFTARKLT